MYSLTDAAFHCKILGPNLIDDECQLYTFLFHNCQSPIICVSFHRIRKRFIRFAS